MIVVLKIFVKQCFLPPHRYNFFTRITYYQITSITKGFTMFKYTSLTLLFILALTILGAPIRQSAQAQEFIPVFEATPCSITPPTGYSDGQNLLCGTVTVPEFHSNPTSDTIQLSVVILKSTTPGNDPLVMFNGGPGSDVLGLLPIMTSNAAQAITQARDVVLMSERGSFGATPLLTCPELVAQAEQDFGIALDDWNRLRLEAFLACRERLVSEGVDLNAYNNPERAADVPMVMEALGYRHYHLWGVSGGGILAQYVLRDHPDGIRTVMTDSGAFPTAYLGTVFFNINDIVSNAYRRLFETCGADSACQEAYPNLEESFWAAVDQLNAAPVMVDITNPQTGQVIEWPLTGEVVVAILANEFANVETLPQVMQALAEGDYDYILERIPNLYASDLSYADALYQSVVCSETAGLSQETASIANAYPQVVAALADQVQFIVDLCAAWGVAAIPEGPAITSDVPILIMEGKFDSNKPPQLGEAVVQNFSTSYWVEFADSAHVVIGPCALAMMAEFMQTPTTSPDTSCVPIQTEFVLTGQALTFSSVSLESLGLTASIPDGWSEVDSGVYLNPADGTVLLLTAFPGDDIEATISAFSQAVALPSPQKLGDVPIGELTWAVYQVIDGDTGSMIAAASVNGQVYLAGLQTSASQLEALADSILRPVVESLVFSE
jgi:pimeloyl-ACP methyl ester carboxylesterase